MSWLPGLLFPWFIAATAAVTLPLVFHLIRRAPRGQKQFSSLMFVPQSPPRLTRRSRLDNLLLLLIRVAILLLLAFAFARPFFSDAASINLLTAQERRIAILLDTSGSMRRSGVWNRALDEANRVLDDVEDRDDVALFSFNDAVETVIGFDEERTPRNTAAKVTAVRNQLAGLAPTWGATQSGDALVFVADVMDTLNDVQQSGAVSQIVLISDLQRGSQLSSLQAYEWPSEIQTTARIVATAGLTNASLQLVHDQADATVEDDLRVRVTNEPDSASEQFVLQWDASEVASGNAQSVKAYVPPGETRIVRIPRPAVDATTSRLVLGGDQVDFDNTAHVVAQQQKEIRVVYLGDDGLDETQGLAYYLDLALVDNRRRKVELVCHSSKEQEALPDLTDAQMAVVSRCSVESHFLTLLEYLKNGGELLFVMTDIEAQAALSRLAGLDDIEVQESSGGYVMLGEIDFQHSLFVPFADPRYNDFTKIRFRQHRRLVIDEKVDFKVIARFDNAAPALLERSVGQGHLIVLTSGWHPSDSRLALSTKFVPLVAGLLDWGRAKAIPTADLAVNDSVPLSGTSSESETRHVLKPDGTKVVLGSQAESFEETDLPGVYVLVADDAETEFCVNLAASESRTAPLSIEELEQFGVKMGSPPTRVEELEKLRQLHDIELEDRQKVWRTTIIAIIGLLILETWLAGRTARSIQLAPGNASANEEMAVIPEPL
jgi:hypothetical protein